MITSDVEGIPVLENGGSRFQALFVSSQYVLGFNVFEGIVMLCVVRAHNRMPHSDILGALTVRQPDDTSALRPLPICDLCDKHFASDNGSRRVIEQLLCGGSHRSHRNRGERFPWHRRTPAHHEEVMKHRQDESP